MKKPGFNFDEMAEDNLFSPAKSEGTARPPLLLRNRRMLFDCDVGEASLANEVQCESSFDPLWENTDQKIFYADESFSPPAETVQSSPCLLSPKICKEVLESKKLPDFVRRELVKAFSRTINAAHRSAKITVKIGITPLPGHEKIRFFNYSLGYFNTTRTEGNEGLYRKKGCEIIQSQGAERKLCSCSKSRCLKYYCECFASSRFCQGCSCVGCHNLESFESEILEAKDVAKEKNLLGQKRYYAEKKGTARQKAMSAGSVIPCMCSRSECLKKYCGCFRNGKRCGADCSCTNCRNKNCLRTLFYNKHEFFLKRYKDE
eukprot:TRINITY_DN9775_c0_g1_i12.p1 TRINITY_DN9775_c0_g1~~TRINITY_DN9775_c0_g1_i12.p1  ORF type:complete len:317 (+),score=38.99 TRINITY_DN9775_c0_g1_i12:415-1365(+)